MVVLTSCRFQNWCRAFGLFGIVCRNKRLCGTFPPSYARNVPSLHPSPSHPHAGLQPTFVYVWPGHRHHGHTTDLGIATEDLQEVQHTIAL